MAAEEPRIDELRGLFAGVDFVMLGPINPGKDAQTKARIGWVAPYGRKDNPTAITAAGHGASALAAAEDAWAQFEAEFGSPPGTSE